MKPYMHQIIRTGIASAVILINLYATAQDFTYSFAVEEVHYGGSPGPNYIEITKDAGGEFTAPQWIKGGHQRPVGYVSGTKAQVKAVISTSCPSSFYLRGRGPSIGGITSPDVKFPMKMITPSGGTAIYDFEEADVAFQDDVIKCYDDFYINWEVSDDGTSWETIGRSSNRLYVTHKQPLTTLTTIYHTVIDVSCHKAGGLSGDNKAIIYKIYDTYQKNYLGHFPGVNRASDGHTLTYYVNAPPGSSCAGTVEEMLISGDGRCGAWASLLKQMIQVQGIDGSSELIVLPEGVVSTYGTVPMTSSSVSAVTSAVTSVYPMHLSHFIPVSEYHFMVKHWGSVSNGDLVELPAGNGLSGLLGYETAKSDYGASGISGQGNVPEPRSIFINHAIVKFAGELYDPSYGSFYLDDEISELEDASIDVVKGTIVRIVHGPPRGAKYYFWVKQVNTGVTEFQTIPIP